MQNNLDQAMVPKLNRLNFAIRPSGDGCEILDANGVVVAWTLDKIWALRIVLALELQPE